MLPEAASRQYEVQQGISTTTAGAVAKLWSGMGDDFDASWARIRPELVDVLGRGQAATAARAVTYTDDVLSELDQAAPPVGVLNPAAFAGSAPDGRPVGTLLDGAPLRAKAAVAAGAEPGEGLAIAGRWLTMVTLTTLADTRRDVYAADLVQRPLITGYTRMLNPPSCSRCIILAGRWYRWNEGFRRHPRCDCQHIPAREQVAGDARTDPYATFLGMAPGEQEKVFGRSEARAIREGADIYKVVNQQVRKLPTSNSVVDQIYRTAGTRTNAVRMLRARGFILDRGQVPRPLAPGVRTDAQILAAGRGRGAVTVGGRTITTGRAARFDAARTGERDILRRSTMTAAERRLYDAHYRLEYALRTGNVPRSIGPSPADLYANAIPATPERIAQLRQSLALEVSDLLSPHTPESVRRLARALGLL